MENARVTILVLGSYVQANCLLVEHLPSAGESIIASNKIVEHGGKGFNVIAGLQRLGAAVVSVIAVGNDAIGAQALQYFRELKIDERYIFRLDTHTGYGVGLIAGHGTNMIAVYPGANSLLSAKHLQPALTTLRAGDWVYAQFEIGDAPILSAFRRAKDCGCTTVLNPSPWRDMSNELLSVTDVLILNEQEAAKMLGKNAPTNPLDIAQWADQIRWWLRTYGRDEQLIVLTLGERGAMAIDQQEIIFRPALCIDPIDTTGAGDAFTAGFLASRIDGHSIDRSIAKANACGAWVAARFGVLQALPTQRDLSNWPLEKRMVNAS